MRRPMFVSLLMVAAIALPADNAARAGEQGSPQRVTVSGELIDTWCYVTEIMYALGSAHHRCAVWCAVGGIPVSIRGDDGTVYMVLRIGEDGRNVANPAVVRIQAHQVTVNGDLYRRDGVNYLFVDQVEDDQGVVNITHPEYGISPFGKDE